MSAAWLNRILILLAWGGIFVAGFLTLAHYMNFIVPCKIGAGGCAKIAEDPRSFWFNIPVAVYGLAGYLGFVVLAALRTWGGVEQMRRVIQAGLIMAGIGTLVSLYLQYVALVQIGARCDWCIASAAIMVFSLIFMGLLSQRDVDSLPNDRINPMVFVGSAILAIGGLGVMVKNQVDGGGGPKVVDVRLDFLAPKAAYFLGPDDAPVTIVEFADFYCPSCRIRSPELIKYQRAHPKTVRIAYRSFPLFEKEGHELSLAASMVAEYAAEKGKYWEFVEGLYSVDKDEVASFDRVLEVAQLVGLNKDEARQRIAAKDERLLDPIYEARKRGEQSGVSETPSFIIFVRGMENPLLARGDNLARTLAMPQVAEAIGPASP